MIIYETCIQIAFFFKSSKRYEKLGYFLGIEDTSKISAIVSQESLVAEEVKVTSNLSLKLNFHPKSAGMTSANLINCQISLA